MALIVFFLVAFYGFAVWLSYLLLVQPDRFFEWFWQPQNRWWGIQANVGDQGKFTRRSRTVALLLLVFLALHALVVLSWFATAKQ
jgi:hypothetical protein